MLNQSQIPRTRGLAFPNARLLSQQQELLLNKLRYEGKYESAVSVFWETFMGSSKHFLSLLRPGGARHHYWIMEDPVDWTTIPWAEEDQVVPHSLEPEDSPLPEVPVPLSPLTSDEEPYDEDDPSNPVGDSDELVDMETELVDDEIDPTEEEVDYFEWEDEDPEEEKETTKEPEPAIEQQALPPLPAFQIYRHTYNVPSMAYTPRKSIPIRKRKRGTPLPASLVAPERVPPTPAWVTHLREWRAEDEIPSQFDVGESSRARQPTPLREASSDPAIPILVARIARLIHHIRIITNELGIIKGNSTGLRNRIQSLEEDRSLDEEAMQLIFDHLDSIQIQLLTQDAQISRMELMAQVMEHRVIASEARAFADEMRAEYVQQQLTHLVIVLGTFLGLW
ncbi:unnamed protein product [Lactuca virosa]|uniref:Uncharacterized protein n=1 Tax=Lactuca virosa TaxID=75947 RepID=A0AAU9LHU1_9ASTR|nr:unnamed protein product [Lactuca virosa]